MGIQRVRTFGVLAAAVAVVLTVLTPVSTGAEGAGTADVLDCSFNSLYTAPASTTPFELAPNLGVFTFNGPYPSGSCSLTDGSSLVEDSSGGFSATGNGNYVNTTCGTDVLTGVMAITLSSGLGGIESPINLDFTITTAGKGPAIAGSIAITEGNHSDGAGATGGGSVTMTPENAGGCLLAPADGFYISGSFAVTLLDN